MFRFPNVCHEYVDHYYVNVKYRMGAKGGSRFENERATERASSTGEPQSSQQKGARPKFCTCDMHAHICCVRRQLWAQGVGGHRPLNMFSKRGRAWDDAQLPPNQRLRRNIADLYLNNDVSAARAQTLFADAQAAGAPNMGDLAKAGKSGSLGKNLSRDLMRKLLKNSRWPPPYQAQIRTWNTKTEKVELQEVPILLPHEVIWTIAQERSTSEDAPRQQLCTQDQVHLNTVCAELECDPQNALGVGLWGDGVPFNYDRSASLDIFSLSVPGFQNAPLRDMRIPLFAMDHKHVVKGDTLDDLMAVLAWSFTFLALGRYPVARHDNAPFNPRSDRSRIGQAGSSASLRGILVECRGDWKHLKDVFRFPQFNENSGICWLCNCTPQTWRLVDETASWRHGRLGHWDFVERLRSKGLEPSPLFETPGLTTSCFKPDWLHVCDLGVACDFLGNFLVLLSKEFPGTTHKARVGAMWQHIQGWYKDKAVENRLDNLYPTMLQAKASVPPKLRAKAAQARGLVPYASHAAAEFLKSGGLVHAFAAAMADELAACYACLSPSKFHHEVLSFHCKRYCTLAVQMESEHGGVAWRVKPKLHLFQELCEFHHDCPSLFWTYRDEDFGGSMAHFARKRGGPARPGVVSMAVINRHCAKHNLPRF